jgi:murein DD-endopeptidase MepM/ murein hydrolase activator NlpD
MGGLTAMRLRSVLALSLASLITALLGSSLLSAHAELRTFEVTLMDGRVVVQTVDVPPGTELWKIDFPDVDEAQVIAITETETAAPAAPPEAEPEPEGWTPKPDAIGEEPPVAGSEDGEPAVGDGARRQRTTGAGKRRGGAGARGHDAGGGAAAREDDRRSRRRGEEGLPTAADPTTSIAVPGPAPIGVPNFFIDKFRIPPFLLSIYQAAGVEYGVRWEVLAAINEIETDYGRNLNVSSAGAVGWMQFMPATWRAYGVDANGDRKKDPYNPVDAIFAAARYLRAAGADRDLARAIFAYNHADWYVDSVLMRARLIGGMPTDLVGSITGLTQGRFPVAARARYADDVDAGVAQRRVAKGTNAAMPVESEANRRAIRIYAKPGSPVVAVQDGKVVERGRSRDRGRYVVLRDAFGNRYAYSHLGSLARYHGALGEPAAVPAAGMYANPPRSRPARRPAKERLFASPARAGAKLGGSERQLRRRGTKRLRVGSRVVGGTELGRIGRTSRERAPHVTFAIRPAGRGAPRIDPKPILDGWKLLETTAIYRARDRNPFFGRDARTPSIGQILLMGKGELEQRVLRNPRIEIYDCGRRDVSASRIDRRVLATLEFLAASGLRPTVTSLTCGHSYLTKSGNVSHHSYGSAVDVAKINGIPILGHQGRGSVTDLTIRRLLTLQGAMQPSQIISLMTYEGAGNTLAMGDHDDHIHVGFEPLGNTTAGRHLAAVLKPDQWIKLIDRIAEIDNPTVRTQPSRDAITVTPSRRRAGD